MIKFICLLHQPDSIFITSASIEFNPQPQFYDNKAASVGEVFTQSGVDLNKSTKRKPALQKTLFWKFILEGVYL